MTKTLYDRSAHKVSISFLPNNQCASMASTGKRCTRCGEVKMFINFHRKGKNSDAFRSECKQCTKIQIHNRYEKYKGREVTVKEKRCVSCKSIKKASEFRIDRLALRAQCKDCECRCATENRQRTAALNARWIVEHGAKCETCGEDRLDALEQVAIDPSKKKRHIYSPTTEANRLRDLENVKILCVCCERVRSFWIHKHRREEASSSLQNTPQAIDRRKKQAEIRSYLCEKKRQIGKCAMCERTCLTQDPVILSSFDFDHLDPSTKIKDISSMVSFVRAKVDRELDKCRLLCANCHKIHTRHQLNQRTRTDALASLEELSLSKEPDISGVDDDWMQLFVIPNLI